MAVTVDGKPATRWTALRFAFRALFMPRRRFKPGVFYNEDRAETVPDRRKTG